MKAVLILSVLVAVALGVSTLYVNYRGTTARVRADSLTEVVDSFRFEAGA